MSAEIIMGVFPQHKHETEPDSPGARYAVQDYFNRWPSVQTLPRGDHFLLWLWSEGFKVVPLRYDDL